jgi:hypothetical protein
MHPIPSRAGSTSQDTGLQRISQRVCERLSLSTALPEAWIRDGVMAGQSGIGARTALLRVSVLHRFVVIDIIVSQNHLRWR